MHSNPSKISVADFSQEPPRPLYLPQAQTPANRLIRARNEKGGQRRFVIIPAGKRNYEDELDADGQETLPGAPAGARPKDYNLARMFTPIRGGTAPVLERFVGFKRSSNEC